MSGEKRMYGNPIIGYIYVGFYTIFSHYGALKNLFGKNIPLLTMLFCLFLADAIYKELQNQFHLQLSFTT